MTSVVYLVQDLLFTSKIRETAQTLGLSVSAARDPEALFAAAAEAKLVIIDLRRPDALAALDRIASLGAEKVGFVDHERVEVMEAARERGCRAYAKGKFSSELAALMAAL